MQPKKAMKKSKYVIGLRSIEQLIDNKTTKINKLIVEYNPKNKRILEIVKFAKQNLIPIISANRSRLSQISGESSHQGVIAEVSRNLIQSEAELRSYIESNIEIVDSSSLLFLVLENIKDPHNLGACMRTACAAGVDAIIVNRSNSVSITSTVSKVACGAAEIVPLIRVKSLKKVLTWMGEYGINRIGTSENASKNLFETNIKGHTLLVMGEEHSGISKMAQKNCDNLLKIPMKGNLSSLNLSVATGICLFEINRKNLIS
tara:strand:+ start:159 stop:938 length:780 start_codon:yes stop_codon:yes gene_type:complete